jgi:tetratricopeptide (TPR) repeat protein
MKCNSLLTVVLSGFLVLWSSCGSSRKTQDEQVRAFLSSSAGYLNQKGTAALDSGRYAEAEHYFREAVSLTALDPALHNNLGVAFYQLGQLDSAIASYATAIRLRPHYVTAYRNMATAYHAQKKYPQALKAIEYTLQQEPQEAENYSLQSLIYDALDQQQAAMSAAQHAIQLAPQRAQYHNNLGTLFFRQGRMDRAIEQFQEAIRLQPDKPEFFFNLANALTRQCRMEESLQLYEKALSIDPHLVGAANNKGLVLMALHQYDAAISAFRQALDSNAVADIVLYNLSVAMMHRDSASVALASIERAIAVRNDLATYYQQKGSVLNSLGRNSEALACFQKAISLDSSLAAGYNDLGNALIAQQDADQAVLAYEKAVELFPESMDSRYFLRLKVQDQHYIDLLTGCADAWEMKADYAMIYNNLGKALLSMGRMDKAEATFKKSISIQSDLPEPYEQLALLYHRQHKRKLSAKMAAQGRLQRAWFALQADSVEAAARYAKQALLIDPAEPDVYAALALVHMRAQQWEQALKQLEKGVALKAPSYRLQLAYGQYWVYRQEREKALACFKRALELEPQVPAAFRVMYQTLTAWGRTAEANTYLAELHYLTGQQLEFAGQWDRALLEYRQAASVLPQDSRFPAAQGLLFLKKHLNAEAEEILNSTIKQDSTQATAWYGLGLLQGDNGQYESAIASLQTAVELKKDFGQAHYSLAVNFYFAQRYEEARRHLKVARDCGVAAKSTFVQALQNADKK